MHCKFYQARQTIHRRSR